MRKKTIAASLAAILLGCALVVSASPTSKEYKQALSLYQRGMYEQARNMFENISKTTGDQMAEGYAVLCATKMQSDGYQTLVEEYDVNHSTSVLRSLIHYQYALNLFDKEDYKGAAEQFNSVSSKAIAKDDVPEYLYKQAYSAFGQGFYKDAIQGFQKVESMPFSDYTAPSRYAIAYTNYLDKNFDEAFSWFEKSAKDPRFSEMSSYYMLECKFMNRDYRYVVNNGVAMFDKVPADRKSHLSRIISESYLVLGDKDKAKEYYESVSKNRTQMSRTDYFYSGSVLYAVEDYAGAIDNFSMMTARTDSLGQLANYNLGYSYIQTKNKVAALNAFKDASNYSFDKTVQEDAYFNYAKLAFDLNHDTSIFDDYMAKYPDLKKGDKIYNYQALACLYNHDYAGAVAAYDNIDELDDSMKAGYMKANYLRANQLIENGSYKDAISCLRAASFFNDKHDTFNQLSRYWLAESYFRSGKYLESRSVFNELYNLSALDSYKEGDLLAYNIAYCDFMEEDYNSAAKWFDTYLEGAAPEYAKEAMERRADCDFIQKKYDAAIEGYQKALDSYYDVNDIYPYYQTGLAYGLQGNTQKKIDILSRVKDADKSAPLYDEAMYELGRAYVAANRNDDAVRCFRNLKATASDNSFVGKSLIELGMIANNRGDSSQALSYYKEVITSLPGTEYAQDALSAVEAIYQNRGEADQYLAYIESIGANKDKSESEIEAMYFNAAEQVFLAGNYSKALVALQNYQSKYPTGAHSAESSFYMAESYKGLSQKENAITWYNKALASTSNSSFRESATRSLADMNYSMEKYSDAYQAYKSLGSIAKMDQNKTNAQTGMMRSAYYGKDYSNAIASADVVKNDPKSSSDLVREADYIKAKSYLATSEREKAYDMFNHLSHYPSTNEGAEAVYLLIQDAYDQGNFDQIQDKVYDFAANAEGQNYWLAKAYLVLGDTFAENDNYSQAKATFESLRDGYTPDPSRSDDVLDNVAMRLERLQKLISK